MGTTTKILATLVATLFCLAAAWWFQRSHVTGNCRTTRLERNGSLIAITDESERAHNNKGHGKPLHGEIASMAAATILGLAAAGGALFHSGAIASEEKRITPI
jgi:hypothetical protein